MQKNKGITLVALVITIIILLILAGVAISMITGGEGLFAKANSAAGKYNQAAKNEADLLNQLLNGNYLNNSGNGQEEEPEVPTNKSHVGYYADYDANGTVDGIIFADLAVGGQGQLVDENGAYTIPIKSGLKEYYIKEESYTASGFDTKPVLSPKEGSTGNDRFYIMDLEDLDTRCCCWYNSAAKKNSSGMTDYATATSVNFDKGRENTEKMVEYWSNGEYGEKNSDFWGWKDLWYYVLNNSWFYEYERWFVPSRAELAAFVNELGITADNYEERGFNQFYWTSSQGGETTAWYVSLSDTWYGSTWYYGMGGTTVGGGEIVSMENCFIKARLCTTF